MPPLLYRPVCCRPASALRAWSGKKGRAPAAEKKHWITPEPLHFGVTEVILVSGRALDRLVQNGHPFIRAPRCQYLARFSSMETHAVKNLCFSIRASMLQSALPAWSLEFES